MMELFVLLNSSELTVSVCNNREKKLKDLEVRNDISKVLFLCTAGLVEVDKSSATPLVKCDNAFDGFYITRSD